MLQNMFVYWGEVVLVTGRVDLPMPSAAFIERGRSKAVELRYHFRRLNIPIDADDCENEDQVFILRVFPCGQIKMYHEHNYKGKSQFTGKTWFKMLRDAGKESLEEYSWYAWRRVGAIHLPDWETVQELRRRRLLKRSLWKRFRQYLVMRL